jgi:glycosyltransferase involved in cell wall biosynthesis
MSPLVSILIPCYNAERWIAQAIESSLAQTWTEKEVIVVDDGSTDSSLDVIQKFDGRIRWQTGPNRGGNAARNRLLELARGEWLQYLDADDWLMPDKILDQINYLTEDPNVDVIYSPVPVEYWFENKPILTENPILAQNPRDDIWILMLRWWIPQTGGQLWRRQALTDVGGWDPEQLCCQDNELYLRLLIHGKRFAYCSTARAVYRIWSENTVSRRDPISFQRCRLEILARAEAFLRSQNQLTKRRLQAVNQTRFEMARFEWPRHREFAAEIISKVRDSEPKFVPSGLTAPPSYRAIYRLLGFDIAEQAAAFRRRAVMLAGARNPVVNGFAKAVHR